MNITLTKEDIKLMRQLRSCLISKTVDLGSLDNLLTSLEGKVSPLPVAGRDNRKNHRDARVLRHVQSITGGK